MLEILGFEIFPLISKYITHVAHRSCSGSHLQAAVTSEMVVILDFTVEGSPRSWVTIK